MRGRPVHNRLEGGEIPDKRHREDAHRLERRVPQVYLLTNRRRGQVWSLPFKDGLAKRWKGSVSEHADVVQEDSSITFEAGLFGETDEVKMVNLEAVGKGLESGEAPADYA